VVKSFFNNFWHSTASGDRAVRMLLSADNTNNREVRKRPGTHHRTWISRDVWDCVFDNEKSRRRQKSSSVTNAAARDAIASVPEGCDGSGHSSAHSFPRQRLATCLKSLDLDSRGRTARPAATRGLAKRPSRLRITWQIWWNLRILGKFARNSGHSAKPNP